MKYAYTLEENIALRHELDKKLKEKEKIDFKYAQQKSNFIEIMRELTRFRREFNEIHSLRSKMILTNAICKKVSKMIKFNEKTIHEDQASLNSFEAKKQKLYLRRQDTTRFIENGHTKQMDSL